MRDSPRWIEGGDAFESSPLGLCMRRFDEMSARLPKKNQPITGDMFLSYPARQIAWSNLYCGHRCARHMPDRCRLGEVLPNLYPALIRRISV